MDENDLPIQPPQLTAVGEKSLPAKCKADLIAYCPTMDLIAVVTEDDELRVFRLNGQRVFGGSYKGDPHLDEDENGGEIRALRWKYSGANPNTESHYPSLREICNANGLNRPHPRCRVQRHHCPDHQRVQREGHPHVHHWDRRKPGLPGAQSRLGD